MRLDYALYVLAAVLLITTVVPFVTSMGENTTETSVWVVATVVLGLFSIGLGYTQRPKTEAQACQPIMSVPQEAVPETQPAATMEAPKEEKAEAPIETAPAMAASVTATLDLTQVKGIGEKRATQLKALGITNVDELSKASAKPLAKKLKISPKTVDKWITNAKQLVK
jgi:predicted flap endonuclease-1-like 5' DNA nuclease